MSRIVEAVVKYHDSELESSVVLGRKSQEVLPNITALAADGTPSEAAKLGVLLVLTALLGHHKQEFMERFLVLGQEDQTALVIALSPVSGF